MSDIDHKTLVIGIGNIGRSDDGLAWALLDRIKGLVDQHVSIHYTYQLNIEHAEKVKDFDKIIFIDAYQGELKNGYSWEKCAEKESYEITSHALEPEVICALSRQLYHVESEMIVLRIQGYDWELKEGLSKKAEANLEKAISVLLKKCAIKNLDLELQV